jgi:hypothetical protein
MENTLERLGETQCSPRRREELVGGDLVAGVRWEWSQWSIRTSRGRFHVLFGLGTQSAGAGHGMPPAYPLRPSVLGACASRWLGGGVVVLRRARRRRGRVEGQRG